LEGLAEAGGICLSETAYTQVKNKLTLGYEYIGEQQFKNIAEPVRVYRIRVEELSSLESLSQQAKVEAPKPRRVRSAHRWVTAGLALLVPSAVIAERVAVARRFLPPP
jgi:adenylate cyclase